MSDDINKSELPDANKLENLNRWLIVLVVFIILWTIGIVLYVDQKTEKPNVVPPVAALDLRTGKIVNPSFTNLFPAPIVSPVKPTKTNSPAVPPLYEQKQSYEKMEFVIVNYFFVEGLVVDVQGDNYTVMYKDHNRVLQRITVPKELLMAPTPGTSVNPASLIDP